MDGTRQYYIYAAIIIVIFVGLAIAAFLPFFV